MGVIFHEGRDLPSEFRRSSGYEGFGENSRSDTITATGWQPGGSAADGLNAVANIVKQASPWDMLTGIFVTKPAAERAAQVEITRLQAESQASSQAMKAETTQRLLYIGGGVVALLALVLVMTKRRRPPAVAGYRRRSRRGRR